MTNEIKPWWKDQKYPALGDAQVSQTWGMQALEKAALYGGPTVTRYSIPGAPHDMQTYIQALTTLGGHAISVRQDVVDGAIVVESAMVAWPDCALETYCTEGAGTYFVTTNKELAEQIIEVSKQQFNARKGSVFVVASSSTGPRLVVAGTSAVDYTAENYTPEVAAVFDHVVGDLNSADPCGRIVLLDGTPGTGKTYLVRALTGLVNKATFVIVPPGLVASLANPDFVSLLMRHHRDNYPIVLIIEDADECIVPRDGGNIAPLSALLNMSDGILGSLLNLRAICTTNAGHLSRNNDAIDPAILRPGRLCKRIQIGKLSAEQAAAAYVRLVPNGTPWHPDGPVVLAEVYRRARQDGWKPAEDKTTRLGFHTSNVPLDPYDFF